jgi:tetratricopeptide (TPR) repeat protein
MTVPPSAAEATPGGAEPLSDRPLDRFERVAVVLGVLTTLVAAVVGWQHTEAAKRADEASASAHALTVDASEIKARSQHLQHVALTLFALGRDQSARGRSVRQAMRFADGGALPSLGGRRRTVLVGSIDRKLELLADDRAHEQSPRLGDISVGGAYEPAADPVFPARFRARGERAATRKLALKDAANERNVEWDKRGNRYVAALAMLGTALYLFGFSLSRHVRDVRGYFLATGFLLFLIAGGWALINIAVPVRTYPERAAEEFARGHALLVSSTGPVGYERARAHFDKAIELRPTFVRAYEERQDAIWRAATPQRATFSSLTSDEALADAIEDLEKARYLGAEGSGVASSLAFAKVLLGLQGDDSELIEDGVELGKEALEADDSDPVAHSNLAVALLAQGRIREATDRYREAATRVLENLGLAQGWLSGTLTDLELVARYRSVLRRDVLHIKQRIVGFVDAGDWTPPVRGPRLERVAVYPNPAHLRVEFSGYAGLAEEPVSIHWYQRTRHGWAHLESVSGFGFSAGEQGISSQGFPYLALTYPPTCLPDTAFRVEIYVGGRLAGAARGVSQSGEESMEPFFDPDSYLLGCRPKGWRPVALEGVANGWVSRDRTRGVYLLRLNDLFPGVPLSLKDDAAIRRTIPALAEAFPAPPSPAPRERYTSDFLGGELYAGQLAVPFEESRESIRMYRYRSGRIIAGAHVEPDGTIRLGLVYGDDAVSYRRHPVFESLTQAGG